MPKLGRKSPILLDNDYALYSPFGTDNTPILDTKIVGSKRMLVVAKNDPAIQPTKPIATIQANDEAQLRRVPKGRYDTTYRREYLNFGQGIPNQNSVEKYSNQQQQQQQQAQLSANSLNPYTVLPPINQPYQLSTSSTSSYNQYQPAQNNLQQYLKPSIDHIITEPPYLSKNQPINPDSYNATSQVTIDRSNDNYLPIEPIYLSEQEERNLMHDVSRELGNYSSNDLKNFYSELTSYDPNLTSYTHHAYISLVAMRNNLPLSESVMRFVMSRYVSANQERGFVNYEELIKFLARCLGENKRNQPSPVPQQQMAPPNPQYSNNANSNFPGLSPRQQNSEAYDPDEQAILRLMHENMREWDQINLINCDNLRKKFYEIDPYNRYILTQREIEDVLYKNRIPIQRSLIFQILEKYCKVASGQYRWPAFVDFLEKTYNLRLPNKKKTHYVLREDENQEKYSSQFTYRTAQLEALRSKASEEERLEEINRQIYNLQNLKEETRQKIESRLDDVVKGESWFTRFMRLANAMYSHRVNAGIDFALPKDEARRLITAYNTVYELNVPDHTIEEGLTRCTLKGNVVIDDLLKVLSRL